MHNVCIMMHGSCIEPRRFPADEENFFGWIPPGRGKLYTRQSLDHQPSTIDKGLSLTGPTNLGHHIAYAADKRMMVLRRTLSDYRHTGIWIRVSPPASLLLVLLLRSLVSPRSPVEEFPNISNEQAII